MTETSNQYHAEMSRVLNALLKISNLVGSVMLLEDILDQIVEITSEIFNCPVCSIYLLDGQDRLILRRNRGLELELISKVSFELNEGIQGWVAAHEQTLALRDARTDSRYKPLPSVRETNCAGMLCSKLLIQDDLIGVMTARWFDTHPFEQNDILLFETVCKMIAIVIEKSRLYQEKTQAEQLATVAVSLTGVAHYIKNVMQTMQGGEYLVNQAINEGKPENAAEGWEILKRANRKIRALVENILNYCRQDKPDRCVFSPNAMILEILNSLKERAERQNCSLDPILDDNVGEILAHDDAIYDSLLNLITNAMDAIDRHQSDGGRVTVRTKLLSGRNQVRIEISDNGVGIQPENLQQIFNLFFSTKGKEGTGIGLAATRKIIQEHGGTIEVSSIPAEGATFTIYFPVHKWTEAED
jgi:signal transduction histidine kinase